LNPPSLSLVIPVLNEAPQLPARLRALQDWRRYAEIIVVDGGSEDGSAAIAEPLVDQLVQSAPGRARQLNAGAARAGGDYLLFLHCDTSPGIAPEHFCVELSRYPQWGFFKVCLSGADWRFRIIETFMNWRSGLTRVATGDQALFVSRLLFEAIDGFADMELMEDVEICKRLRACAAPRILAPPVTTSSRRWERAGVMRTVLLMWSLRTRYWLGADPAGLARRYRRG
jgi:rSAM/selenodomain-associated transferase 2